MDCCLKEKKGHRQTAKQYKKSMGHFEAELEVSKPVYGPVYGAVPDITLPADASVRVGTVSLGLPWATSYGPYTDPYTDPYLTRGVSLGLPWAGLTMPELIRIFRARSRSGTGRLIPREFGQLLTQLGLEGEAVGPRLFKAIDTDPYHTDP